MQRIGDVNKSHSISIIIPVFNERRFVEEVIRRISSVKIDNVVLNIIIIDDGSIDGSIDKILNAVLHRRNAIAIFNKKNCGKGASIRRGLDVATGDFIIIQDCDLEYDPNIYPFLLAPLLAGRADIVYGCRTVSCLKWSSKIFRYAIFLAFKWMYGKDVRDICTGAKAFRTTALRAMKLRSDRFEFCVEVTTKAIQMGASIVEIPIAYHPRTRAEGKKINFLDVFPIIFEILKGFSCRTSGRLEA